MLIGNRLKELREARKISLTELSNKSRVQLATLSRIENLKMTGTLHSHIAIAKALDVTLPQLYSNVIMDDAKKVEVQTLKPKTDVFVGNEESSYEILTPKVLAKKMMPILLRIKIKGKTTPEQSPIGTDKFVFVLEGTIELKLDEETYTLSKHNTIYFDCAFRHYFINVGKTEAKVICVSTPVAL